MDDVEKILEKLNRLEQSVNELKNELNEIKSEQANDPDYNWSSDSIRNAFSMFNNVNTIVKELKRQMRRSFRKSSRGTIFTIDDEPFNFDFDIDLSHIGDFISNTVQTALSSLDHLTEDYDGEPRSIRIKMKPGKDLHYTGERTTVPDELPIISDIQYAKEILIALENKIASLETLIVETNLSSETLATELDALKTKKLVIQEKFGQQRFLMTKLGKKVLNELKNKPSGEQTN